MNGPGSTTPASPSASVCRRVNRSLGIVLLLALQLPRGAGGRALGAGLEPFRDHVDLRGPRPGKDARDIEVCDGEAVAEQVGAAIACVIEHPQRLSQLFFGGVG